MPCVFLDEENSCSIYKVRPSLCWSYRNYGDKADCEKDYDVESTIKYDDWEHRVFERILTARPPRNGLYVLPFAIKEMMESNLSIERGGQMRKKYYDDAKENAAFERCVDVVTVLILKYGPAIKRKWILREWIKNIQADCFWRSLACKRYQRYFDCMKAIVKNDAT